MSSVAEVLRAAEQVIAERGWRQGEPHAGRDAVCLVIAIDHAACGNYTQYTKARKALAVVVTGSPYESVSMWNDRPGRTETEVRDALLAAAQRAEASDG